MDISIDWSFIFPYLKDFKIISEGEDQIDILNEPNGLINICYRMIIIYLQEKETEESRLLSTSYKTNDSILENENRDFKIQLINSFLVYNNYPL